MKKLLLAFLILSASMFAQTTCVNCGGISALTDTGSQINSTEPIRLPNNTFLIWRNAANSADINGFRVNSSDILGTNGNFTVNGTNTVTGTQAITTIFGAAQNCTSNSELLTLSTGGTTTDTTANLLPANSVITGVVARVTTTITTATSWQLGDPTTAGRFTTANSTMTANTTDTGSVFLTTGIASATTGMWQSAAAKVRVTTVGTPGAGAIRITVFSCTLVPPTS